MILDHRGRPIRRRARRSWGAGQIDLLRSNWPMHSRPPDADIRSTLEPLRARSRHEAQNTDHARAFLRECKINVIGHRGVILQSKAETKSGTPDARAREAIERAWIKWGNDCEVSGRWHWVDLQNMAIETVARDGEALFRMYDAGGPHGFQLQAIDPVTLDVKLNQERTRAGSRIVMGVEVDQNHRPIAYHFTHPDALGRSYSSTGARKRAAERVPADQILHIYVPEWVSQTRGVPWMATALRRLNDLNGYDEAAVVAARAGAAKMGWLQRDEDAPPPIDENGQPIDSVGDGYGPGGEVYQEFDAGTIGSLPPGYSFQGWDPRYPHSEHGSFTKAVLRGVASGLGVDYNTIANDAEGVNYSSLRHFALVQREIWKSIQEWLIRCFHRRAFNHWLDAALLVGIPDRRGRLLRADRVEDFRRVYWQARRWQWVDPQKDANAAAAEIAQRTRSISSVIRERGEDPEEVWKEIQAEQEMLAEMGIPPAAVGAPPPEPETETEGADDADDAED